MVIRRPGFRLGSDVIQAKYTSQAGPQAYLLITTSGKRVELRRVGSSNVYEAVDSSYLQLTELTSTSLLLRNSDGLQLSFSRGLNQSEFECTQIKDRNGNFMSAVYQTIGADDRLSSITDSRSSSQLPVHEKQPCCHRAELGRSDAPMGPTDLCNQNCTDKLQRVDHRWVGN